MFSRLVPVAVLLFFSMSRAEVPAALAEVPPEEQPDKISVDRVIELIESRHLQSVEETLAAIAPSLAPMNNYVLMYRSRSLQEATPQAPRVIAFTPSGKWILAFNGGGRASGADTLEMIQWRDDSLSFEFREVEFFPGGKTRISESNPSKCTACHQSSTRVNIDMRPNWEPYAFWPGAYGSNDGSMDLGTRGLYGFEPQDQEILDEILQEKDRYIRFSQTMAGHPRYRYLGTFNAHLTHDFTKRLAALNFLRLVRLISSEKEIFSSYHSAFDYALWCGWSAALHGTRLLEWNYSQPMRSYPYREHGFQSISDLVTPIFEPLGVDTSDWSMDFRTNGRFAFVERFGTPGFPEREFQGAWEKVLSADKNCSQTLDEMKRVLPTFFSSGQNLKLAARWPVKPANVSTILNHCAACHTGEHLSTVPYINFLDENQLRAALSAGGKRRGTLFDEILYRIGDMPSKEERMPPSQPLERAEIETLIEYLRSLKRGER